MIRYYYDGAGLDDPQATLMRLDVPAGGKLYEGTGGEVFIHRNLAWRPCDVVRRVFGSGDFQPLTAAEAQQLEAVIRAHRSRG